MSTISKLQNAQTIAEVEQYISELTLAEREVLATSYLVLFYIEPSTKDAAKLQINRLYKGVNKEVAEKACGAIDMFDNVINKNSKLENALALRLLQVHLTLKLEGAEDLPAEIKSMAAEFLDTYKGVLEDLVANSNRVLEECGLEVRL